jgi:hypothetical protein
VFQVKYLYAEHVFGWGAEQVCGPWQLANQNADGFVLVGLLHQLYLQRASVPHPFTHAVYVFSPYLLCALTRPPVIISCFKPSSQPPSASALPSDTAPTHLARSITFDLYVARGSLLLDMLSDCLVALHLSPSPFVFAGVTSISALASGATPALHSLALCILQRSSQGNPDIGALFSGMSTLAALGQAILAVSSIFPPFLLLSHPYM